MKKRNLMVVAAVLGASSLGFSEDGKKKNEYHCEKDGAELNEVKTKKDCKEKGGKWTKESAHEHKDGDGGHK